MPADLHKTEFCSLFVAKVTHAFVSELFTCSKFL